MKFHIFAAITVPLNANVVLPDCKTIAVFPTTKAGSLEPASVKRRIVHAYQRKVVDGYLTLYCKSILLKLLNTTARGEVKT